jgi:hypothetical protein
MPTHASDGTGLAVRTGFVAGLLLALLAGLLAAGCDSRAAAVKQAMTDLIEANENRDGDKVASMYSRSTIEHYDGAIKRALSAKKAEIRALPLNEQIEILGMRTKHSLADLRTLDGRQYIKRAVRDGRWAVEWGVEDYGGIRVQGSTAWMEVKKPDTRVRTAGRWRQRDMRKTHNVRFYLEDDAWKLDETSLFDVWNEVIRDELNDSGMQEEEFLLEVAGIDPDDADRYWNPPKK